MPNANRLNSALTLIELLVVITILGILGLAASPIYNNFLISTYYHNKLDEITTSLNTARTNTLSGKSDSQWGVHLSSTTITLFQGSSYASRNSDFDQNYKVPASITLSGTTDIIFTKPLGFPSSTASLTISSANDSATISVNQYGTVDVN